MKSCICKYVPPHMERKHETCLHTLVSCNFFCRSLQARSINHSIQGLPVAGSFGHVGEGKDMEGHTTIQSCSLLFGFEYDHP